MSIDVISLAGHSPNQVGILVDSIFFCADVVLPESILAKYRIPYLHSVSAHLKALDTAASIDCTTAIPGHGPVVHDLTPLIEVNKGLVNEVIEVILECAKEPVDATSVLTTVLRYFEAPVHDASSFYLLHPTIYAFLSHTERNGLMRHEVNDARSLWTTT